jgi:hypothetical protein
MADPIHFEQPPAEIAREFYPHGLMAAERIGGGKVNTTYRVMDSLGCLSILQRLGGSSHADMTVNYAVVASHLESYGFTMPQLLQTAEGAMIATDQDGELWRGYTYIPCDPHLPPFDNQTLVAFSGLVGRIRSRLALLDYVPKYSITGLHDPRYTRQKLLDLFPTLRDADKSLSSLLLEAQEEETFFDGKKELLHGDPKPPNALFRNRFPFVLIDWDDMILGDPLIDIGDMLRAATGYMRDGSEAFESERLRPLVEAYARGLDQHFASNETFDEALGATRAMCIMLAMRYIIDTAEGSYFQWAPSRAPSHAEQCRQNARRQWLNYQALL